MVYPNISKDYPNITNEQLAAFVHCARVEHTEMSMFSFETFCPRLYRVKRVEPFPNKRQPYCRWWVEYCKIDHNNSCAPKTCFKDLTRFRPINTRIVSKRYPNPVTVVVTFEVTTCNCEGPARFDNATPRTIIKENPPDLERLAEAEISMDNFLNMNLIKTEPE